MHSKTFLPLMPDEAAALLASRLKAERLRLGWKQGTLARRSGVSVPTIRRYEIGGQTTVMNLLKICHALGRLDEVTDLFQPPVASSIEELEQASGKPKRKRGTR